jgi:DoxX-like family
MAALMLLATIPDLLQADNAIAVFMHLGYPRYLLPFLGMAKGLAIVGVLMPRFPRLKEWVYAGLSIDVGGALYSHLSVNDGPSGWMPALIALILVGSSYLTYRLRQP